MNPESGGRGGALGANLCFWAFLAPLLAVLWLGCLDPQDDPAVAYVLKDVFQFLVLLFAVGFTVVTVFALSMERMEGPGVRDPDGPG